MIGFYPTKLAGLFFIKMCYIVIIIYVFYHYQNFDWYFLTNLIVKMCHMAFGAKFGNMSYTVLRYLHSSIRSFFFLYVCYNIGFFLLCKTTNSKFKEKKNTSQSLP